MQSAECRIRNYNMKRIICLFVSIFLILPLFSGCHGTSRIESFKVPESFDETKEYEISFWAKNDTNMTQVNIYKKAIEDFQKLYPNITVNLRLYTDYGKIYNDVITNIATGTTPNVCITYPDHIATYMTGENTVVPLDGLMQDKKYGLGGSELKFDGPDNGELVEKFLSECTLSGSHYAVPFMRSTEACYVNKTYVEKLGFTLPDTLTWDFVWQVADAATEKDAEGNYKVNGQKVLIPFIYKSTDNMMIQMLKQRGAGYSNDKAEILLFNDTTKDILYTVADHVKKGAFSTFKISSYPANFLNAGQCIFAIDSTAGATWMGSSAPLCDIAPEKLVKFETEVMSIPQVDIDDPVMISQGPSMCVFNKEDSGEVLASWLFTQYMLTNDVQIAYAQTEGYVPVTEKAQFSDEYRNYIEHDDNGDPLYYDVKLKASKLLIENTDNTFVTSVFNGSASLRNAAGQLIEEVTKSIRRKQTVDDEYIENLYDETRSLYRLDQINGEGMTSAGGNLGPLPAESVILLSVLGVVWLGIVIYVVADKLKKRRSAG